MNISTCLLTAAIFLPAYAKAEVVCTARAKSKLNSLQPGMSLSKVEEIWGSRLTCLTPAKLQTIVCSPTDGKDDLTVIFKGKGLGLCNATNLECEDLGFEWKYSGNSKCF